MEDIEIALLIVVPIALAICTYCALFSVESSDDERHY
jgi:hypothetical protein